jgi:hypothetical protein
MATYSGNTTIKINDSVNESGTSSSSNEHVYTVPAGMVFIGTVAVSSGTIEGGVTGGGNTIWKESGAGSRLVILGPGRTVRIGSSGVKYAVTGFLIENSPS